MKIGIILGSIRQGRNGESVVHWVKEGADAHGGAEFEIVDLAEYDVPPLTAPLPPMAQDRNYGSEAVTAWGAKIDESGLAPLERRSGELDGMLDQLLAETARRS